jgi:hypothetical protein
MASMDIYSDFPFGDEQSLRSFFLENGLRHTQYAALIATETRYQVAMFNVFDDRAVSDTIQMMRQPKGKRQMPLSLMQWLQLHATLHQSETLALGLGTNYDLYDADFTDPVSLYDWLQSHALLHDYEDQILGV